MGYDGTYQGNGRGMIWTHDYPCPTSPVPVTTLQPDYINYFIETYVPNCCDGASYRNDLGSVKYGGALGGWPIIMFGLEKWNGTSWEHDGEWADSGPLAHECWTYKSISFSSHNMDVEGRPCGESACYTWSNKFNRFTENQWTGFLMTGYTPQNWPLTGSNGTLNKFPGYLWGHQGGPGQAAITGYPCCGISETIYQGSDPLEPKKCWPGIEGKAYDGTNQRYGITCVTKCPTFNVDNCHDYTYCSPDERAAGGSCLDEFPCCARCPPCTTLVPPSTTSVPSTCPPCDCDCDAPACDEWGFDGQCILFNGKKYQCVGGGYDCTLCPEVGDIPAYWQEIICTTIAPTTPLPTTCHCNTALPTPDPATRCRDFSVAYRKGDCQTIYNSNTSRWELWQVGDRIGDGFTTVSAWMSVNCTDPSLDLGLWELVSVC